jgi:hypothetical protein
MSEHRPATHPYRRCSALAMGVALGLAAGLAGAQPMAPPSPESRVYPASRSAVETVPREARYRPGESGVRRAAAEGPDALRRYIWRTRMIYNYYYWDFAKRP